jgi:ribosomal protein S18 acetylase RimI-like enzyme
MDNHIRQANLDDVPIIVNFTFLMLGEMATMGGRPLVEDFQAKASLAVRVRDCLGNDEHLFLLAERLERDQDPVGFVEARIFATSPFFVASRILHIHSVYVLPTFRRVGIGRNLIQAALDWGCGKACRGAELNTLVWNPARSLYKQLGFQVSEYRMTIELSEGLENQDHQDQGE